MDISKRKKAAASANIKSNKKTNNDLAFFFGSNGRNGYITETDEISEDSLNHLYIIKGGPGTGKSTFMKECAASAAKKGASCTYYYCGSDSASIDAVVITLNGKSIGITDGTAPHTADPKYPGAASEIIDLGKFWDKDILKSSKETILSLSKSKNNLFSSAYKYLNGAAAIEEELQKMIFSFTDMAKMDAAVSRIANNYIKFKGNKISRCIHAVTMRGKVTLNTFGAYENQYKVIDTYRSGKIFLGALSKTLSLNGIAHIALIDPISQSDISAIALPESRTFFSLCNEKSNDSYSYINMQRFIIPSAAAEVRGRRRFTEKCFNSLVDGACDNLIHAAKYHFELENIYKSAMNFEGITNLQKQVSKETNGLF